VEALPRSIRGCNLDREALSWILTKATVSDDFVTPAARPLHVHPDSVAFQLRKIGTHNAEKINETLGRSPPECCDAEGYWSR